jgi:hypothetical protein
MLVLVHVHVQGPWPLTAEATNFSAHRFLVGLVVDLLMAVPHSGGLKK